MIVIVIVTIIIYKYITDQYIHRKKSLKGNIPKYVEERLWMIFLLTFLI